MDCIIKQQCSSLKGNGLGLNMKKSFLILLILLVSPSLFAASQKPRSFYQAERSHLVEMFASQGFEKSELITILWQAPKKESRRNLQKPAHCGNGEPLQGFFLALFHLDGQEIPKKMANHH